MAEKRMFAKTIIDSDAFLSMSATAQLLYFHLSMRADDDGFVNKPKAIMKSIGCNEDDMNLLILKKFIIPFESGVIVIKHWRINNYLRKDTYHETTYKKEKELLDLDENQAYTLRMRDEPVHVDKISIDKTSEDKINIPIGIEDAFKDFEKMRKTIKKPLTDRAKLMIINKLDKLSNGDVELQNKILNQSIVHCWQDVYPLKTEMGNTSGNYSVGDLLNL